jgi:hypothetical protein
MSLTESQHIRQHCLKVIRKASMHEKRWEWTILDAVHEVITRETALGEDEYPIVSFCAGPNDWTLMTTHRMAGSTAGHRNEIRSDDFGATDFGNFKQDLDSPRITRAIIEAGGRTQTFLYESGYASMAPIYYFRFWTLKWPVLRAAYQRHATS